MTVFLYTALLALLYFAISLSVIRGRWKHQISLGSGEAGELLPLVSAHSNFASYTPLFLFMLFLLESAQLPSWAVHGFGAVFSIGRLLHFLALTKASRAFRWRKTAMMMTFWPLIIAASLLLFYYFKPRLEAII